MAPLTVETEGGKGNAATIRPKLLSKQLGRHMGHYPTNRVTINGGRYE